MKQNYLLKRLMLMSMFTVLMGLTASADGYQVKTSALSEYDQNAPIGFGASITGSGDLNPVTVTTLDELTEALSGTDAKTIYVNGTITFTGSVNISDVKNKTIYGLGGATFQNLTHSDNTTESGILTLSSCDNIIIRNITFKGAGAYDIDGSDNLTLTGSTNIWIDHCDFQDGVDGNLDCNNGSDNICVSWCRFRYLTNPWSGGSGGSNDHRFSNLWGGGDGNAAKDEGKLNTTFYACWWDNGCKQRMPRVRFGKVHILNCLYSTNASSAICIGAGYKSNIYAENNVFSGTITPWQNYATASGYTDYNIKLVGNSGAADAEQSSGSIAQFVPSYTYTAIATSNVQAAVTASNGAGATLTIEDATSTQTIYSWDQGTETGGEAVASGAEDSSSDINSSCIRLKGKNDFSTNIITVTFSQAIHAGDLIHVTAYRNKDASGKTSGFKAKFEKGTSTVASSTGMEFVNINDVVAGTDEYGTEANTCTFIVPDDADGSTTMTMTRSHTATNLYVTKLEITATSDDETGDNEYDNVAGSVTWAVGNETEATISSEINDAILTTGVTVGSGLTATPKTYLETSMIAYQPSTSNPGAVASAMIEYRVKAYPGIKFKPTSVSYNAVKDGTDNATYKWSYTIDGTESAITEVSKDNIVRNNNTSGTPAMQHTHNLTASKCDEFTFRIYVSGFANTKKLGIGNVVISGTVSGSKAPLETYTVTFANNDADAQGIAPSAVNVTQYESTTMPVNKTLYKDGYTLTGWTDGTNTYNIGTDFTPTANTTLNPVFTQNSVSLSETLKPVVIKWDFQTGQGAPTFELQGNSGILVTQATVNKSTIDVKLDIDATNGKFNNASWTDWCQVNEGTTFTMPSKNGATVEAFSMSEPKNGSDVKSTLDDNEYASYTSNVATYSTTNESGSSVLVIKGGGYYRYIQLTYPGSGAAWANFESFEMDLRNGAYITSKETSNTTIGFKKDGDNIVRSEADDDANIGTITGKFHSDDHGLQNFSMMVAVPGYVKVSAGTCAWGGNLSINGSNGFSYTVNTNTGACYHQNTTANKVYAYYTSNEGTTLTIAGGSYMPYIAVESVDFYTLTGTINGGNIDGKDVILTSELTGQSFMATVAGSAFTVNVPADTYAITLSNIEDFVISDPTSVVVSADAPLTINVVSATPQTVSGAIANAPAEAFTLTFTGANYTESVECAANATSFTKDLMPDTYTMSSNVGSLSPLSQESFKVVKDAVTHNIYFPEAAVPAATQAEITVDNTATVAANIYNKVSDALAAAKAGNISSPVITLTSGQTYREQVIVDQANVTLKTSGTEKATITFYYGIGYTYYSLNADGYYDKDRAMTRNDIKMIDPARWGCTVKVTNKGTNFKAENIIFENSFNQYYTDEEVTDGVRPNGVQSITYDRTLTSGQSGYKAADSKAVTERAAAIAIENNPTGVELYNCEFRGSQDTFYTSGKIHVKNSNIIGNTDYIFGGGYVVFDDCDLTIGGYSDKETSAYITASNGGTYIFRDCTVKKTGRAYVKANLGRDWGGTNANVYYLNLKNEIGSKLDYKWTNMGGAVTAGTANLHIYDFDPTVNANYNTTGSTGANVNGVLTEDEALPLYANVVTNLGFTPAHIYEDVVELGESSAYNKCRIAASDNVERNVTLTRAIGADKWNTIVLPFDMSAEQITATFGEGTQVAALTNGTAEKLSFNTVTTMTANQPYAIKVPAVITAETPKSINGVTIKSATPTQAVDGDWQFVGTYAIGNIPQGSFFFSDNKLWEAEDDTNTIKGFRAWFTYNGANAARNLTFSIDDETTDIAVYGLKNKEEITNNKPVYNLSGQRVSVSSASSVNSVLPKGVYIINGRKVVIK